MTDKKSLQKKVSVTFRIVPEDMSELRKESKKKGISANSLVSQIIRQHVAWHSRSSDAGQISISKHTFRMFLEALDVEKIIDIAQTVGKKKFKSIILMLRGEFTLDSWLDFMEMWAQTSGFAFRRESKDGKQNILIQHDLGNTYSIFLRELYNAVFLELGVKIDIQITDESVIIQLENRTRTL